MAELLLGIGIGFGAGVSPGPLLTLVLTTTLQRGFGAGVRVACSPLLTDGPIILLVVLVVGSLPAAVATALALGGGLFVIYLGAETVRGAAGATLAAGGAAPPRHDLWRGALVNALSPHPWLFWLAVGGPILVGAWERTPPRAAAFLVGFYGLLVGSKVALAWAAALGRRLTDRWYRRLLAGAGALLVLAGALLVLGALP